MEVQLPPERTRSPVTALVIGLVAGMFSALLGVGGGLLMVPAMVFLLNIRQHRAHGTSLAVILPTAIAGVRQYAGHGKVDWTIALLLAVGGVFGAMIGARLAALLNAPQLKQAFGIFVVVTGIVMIAFPGGYQTGQAPLMPSNALGWVIIVLVGIGAGTISGLLGVGGGIVMVPAIVFLLGTGQKLAQGISLAVIIPVAISGALIHYRQGNVIPNLALWLSGGAVVGATVIGHQVGKIEDETLKLLFGIFLIVVGVSMVRRRRRPQGEALSGEG